MRWVVVKTHPSREHFAAECIARQGYGVFLPRVLVHVGHGSHRYALAKPLFPSYLFAAFEARWRPLLSTFGVAAVLMAGEAPGIVPIGVIDQLRSRLDKDGFVVLPRRRRGDQVRIARGPFARHSGVVQGMPGRDRVRVLLSVLGGQTSVLIAEHDLASAP